VSEDQGKGNLLISDRDGDRFDQWAEMLDFLHAKWYTVNCADMTSGMMVTRGQGLFAQDEEN
jgi:hypothetical protein